MFKHFNVKLEVVSPLHIGNGEEYYPTDYVLKDNKINIIDKNKLLDSVIAKKKYNDFLKLSMSLTPTNRALLEFLKDNSDGCYSYSINVEKSAFEYIKKEGAFRAPISRFVRSKLDDIPYIPGSTVKGSIRTAILELFMRRIEKRFEDKMDKEKFDRKTLLGRLRKDCRRLEEFLSMNVEDARRNKAQNDIMKFVKVSDFMPSGDIKQKVYKVFAVGKAKDNKREVKNIPDILECVGSGSLFKGEVSIHASFLYEINKILEFFKLDKIKSISENNLAQWVRLNEVNNVYLWEDKYFDIGKDIKFFSSVGNVDRTGEYEKRFKKFQLSKIKNKNEFYMKIGKHGGAVSKTVKGCRQVTIRVGRDKKDSDHQSTLWLAGGHPLGWVKGYVEEISGF